VHFLIRGEGERERERGMRRVSFIGKKGVALAYFLEVDFREVERCVGGQRSRNVVQQLDGLLLRCKLRHGEEELALSILLQLVGVAPIPLFYFLLSGGGGG
jgi:hypothetical protein